MAGQMKLGDILTNIVAPSEPWVLPRMVDAEVMWLRLSA